MHVTAQKACRIVARSLFRELIASGYETADLLSVATELLDLILRDAEAARTGGGRVSTTDGGGGATAHERTPRPPLRSPRDEVIMHFENVLRCIRELEIDTRGATMDSHLGADVGMDSQEIVELVLLIENAYDIHLPDRLLSKASTLRDTVGHIERLLAERRGPAPTLPGFDHRCEARAVILRPRVDVYRALHRLEDWTRHLPHVVGLDVLYDDGRYQEFKMRVASKTGVLEVRSIRDCDGVSSIDFFQPEPPPYLLHHAGGWRFSELGDGEHTEVLTFHEWRLRDEVARAQLDPSKGPYEEQVKAILLEHAKAALDNWKRVLEARRPLAAPPPSVRTVDALPPPSVKPRSRRDVELAPASTPGAA